MSAASTPVADLAACSPDDRPVLAERELLSGVIAGELAGTFKCSPVTRACGCCTRSCGPVSCASDLAVELGMAPQAVSNQLQRLADRRIVTTRREGNRILYRIVDACVPALLDLALCLTEEARAVDPVASTRS